MVTYIYTLKSVSRSKLTDLIILMQQPFYFNILILPGPLFCFLLISLLSVARSLREL